MQYFGHNSLKQFIRNKPIRFGFKNWVIAGKCGYCYHIKLYCGKEEDRLSNSLGSSVVLDLVSKVKPNAQNCIFMDNFFTSYSLLCQLKEMNLPALGTMRSNRLSKCPLECDETFKKKERGSTEIQFDDVNEITISKSMDNKPVIVGCNYDSGLEIDEVKRWKKSKDGSSHVNIKIPAIVKEYNSGMGGVDQMDNAVCCYRIAITSKKWYFCLITNLIDISIANAWNIQRKLGRTKMDLLDFKSAIATTYLKKHETSLFISRPSKIPKTLPGIRFDRSGHEMLSYDKQR